MRSLIIFFSVILILLYLSTCKDSGTDPPVNGKIDTTSHDFVWQIDTIGINRSYFLDVAVIDENNIWAVGEINTEDTGIPDSNGVIIPPYNAAHWDGNTWTPKHILSKTFIGTEAISKMNAVIAFSPDDIWMFSGHGGSAHWAGINWITDYVRGRQGEIRSAWGTSSNNFYLAGTNGSLTHYNGSSWRLIPSGTELDINDIWGTKNERTGEWEIYAVASDVGRANGRKLLRVDGTVQSIPTDSLPDAISSIWFVPGEKYYVCGNGLYETTTFTKPWTKVQNQVNYYKVKIRGTAGNDIFMCGSFGLLSHFNGLNWYHYTDNELVSFNGSYTSLYVNQNDVVVVGGDHVSALVVRGTRIG